jgi:hypothetical protein
LHSQQLDLTAISVSEVGHDDEDEAIDWVLLTNVEITTAEQALVCVDYYACRWQIEVFHRILKTGCRVEGCRLTKAQALSSHVGLMSIVAWHLHWLSAFSRQSPKASGDQIFTTQEQAVLKAYGDKLTKKKTKRRVLKAHDYVILLARLGGFLGRKHDGEPGPEVIWRGWRRLQDMVEALSILGTPTLQTYV